MKFYDKIGNFACFLIATIAFAGIFRSHLLYMSHHGNHEEHEQQICFMYSEPLCHPVNPGSQKSAAMANVDGRSQRIIKSPQAPR